MASSAVKSIVSLIALIFFMGAALVMGYGIFEFNRTKDEAIAEIFIIPATIANTLAVIFLLYLTFTLEDASTAYKLFIIILLLGGLIAEIYLTMFSEQKLPFIFSYIVMVINFFFRGFLVLQYVQSGNWVRPTWPEVTNPVTKAVESVKSAVTESRPAEEDKGKVLHDLWRTVREEIKKVNPDYKESTLGMANRFVNEARESGTITKDTLREAMKMIKTNAGEDIKPVAFGGRRRS